jgi:hypothetical protein
MATSSNGKNPTNITIDFVTVTKAQAWDWLENHNLKNRFVQQRTVHKYARRMLSGKWATTGETIKFDLKGNLIDGQHRLWAFIETGLDEMEFLIMKGVPLDAQLHIDTPAPRTPAHTLQMNGIPDGRLLAASIKLVTAYEAGLTPGMNNWRFTPDNEEVLDEANSRPALCASTDFVATDPGFKPLGKPSAMVFTHYVTTQLNPAVARTFWRRLLDASYEGPGDPIQRLRERLLISKATRQGAPGITATCAMIFKAWNAHVRGRTIGPLHWSQNGIRPEKFPKAIATSRPGRRPSQEE